MNDKEKKEAIDAEVNEAEKKENGFTKFFNKAKASVNSALLENKIESTFNGQNNTFSIYSKNETFGSSVHGAYTSEAKEQILIFGTREIKPYSVIIDSSDETAYYVTATSEGSVHVVVDGVEYERKGTLIDLDKNVEEVDVVKAGKRYFIYKG